MPILWKDATQLDNDTRARMRLEDKRSKSAIDISDVIIIFTLGFSAGMFVSGMLVQWVLTR